MSKQTETKKHRQISKDHPAVQPVDDGKQNHERPRLQCLALQHLLLVVWMGALFIVYSAVLLVTWSATGACPDSRMDLVAQWLSVMAIVGIAYIFVTFLMMAARIRCYGDSNPEADGYEFCEMGICHMYGGEVDGSEVDDSEVDGSEVDGSVVDDSIPALCCCCYGVFRTGCYVLFLIVSHIYLLICYAEATPCAADYQVVVVFWLLVVVHTIHMLGHLFVYSCWIAPRILPPGCSA